MTGRLVTKKISESLLLGTCLPCLYHNATKVRVPMYELDEYIFKYYENYYYYYAYNPKKICKVGDTVLIKKLDKNLTKLISHEIVEVVFALGDMRDPVTGKKCVQTETRDEIEKRNKIFGLVSNSFDYNTAPKRGWQEGKKDFSDKDVYVRYHEFSKEDDEHDDPYSFYKRA